MIRAARAIWPVDRDLRELRWAAVTLATMAILAGAAKVIDPAGSAFDRAFAVTGLAALAASAVAWSPIAARLADRIAIRRAIGPAVVAITLVSTGLADVGTLQLPPTAPLIVLAMAYAAMTPGYPYAAAVLIGTSVGMVVAHGEVVRLVDQPPGVSDEFTVRFLVTLIASAGMALVVRSANESETRAAVLAARSDRRIDELERVNRIVARFDGSRPVRDVIQEVVDDIAREFDIALVSMYLLSQPDRLEVVGLTGYSRSFHEIEVGSGVIGRAAATRRTAFVPDVLRDPDYQAVRDDVRSEVAAPVVHGDELLGVVDFEGTLEHPIGPTQVALAEVIVRALAAALHSARLDDERRERLHAIERVLEVSRSLVADLDRPRIVASIVETVEELLSADIVALFSAQADGVFRLEAGRGIPTRAIGFEVRGRTGLVGRAISERVRIDGIQRVEAWPTEFLDDRPGGARAHAAMALPIEVDDSIEAVLFVTRVGAERPYTPVDRAIADLLTAQIAIALRNADLHARVAESALRDPLTGLLNRRYFDESVEVALANARRTAMDLSLIVLDLDRFSAVNNEHGHAVGDAVLRRVARAIRGAVREGDVVVRYGGEEFVVIAPNTDGDGAVLAAERIRHAVSATAIEPIDDRVIPMTISAGVASLVDETDGRALFRAADSALLAAKRAGRDRVSRI